MKVGTQQALFQSMVSNKYFNHTFTKKLFHFDVRLSDQKLNEKETFKIIDHRSNRTSFPKLLSLKKKSTFWQKQNDRWDAFKMQKPHLEMLIRYLMGGLLATLLFKLFEFMINRRTEKLKALEEVRKHINERWETNYQILSELLAKESETGFYLYSQPNPKKLLQQQEDNKKLTYYLEQNERLTLRVKQLSNDVWSEFDFFLSTEVHRQQQQLLDDLNEQKFQLLIAKNLNQALYFYKKRDYEKSQTKIDNVMLNIKGYGETFAVENKLNPLLATAYNLEGKIKRIFKDISGAQTAYTLAIEKNPDDVRILSNYALFLSEEIFYGTLKQSYQDALSQHKKAYQMDSSNPIVLLNQGRGYYLAAYQEIDLAQKIQLFDKALYRYEQVLKVEPKNSTALLYRGIAWMDQGQWEKALSDFQAALIHNPTHTSLLCRRALVYAEFARREWCQKSLPKAQYDLNQLLTLLNSQVDVLEGVDEKIQKIETLSNQFKHLNTYSLKEGIDCCQNVARFFYQKNTDEDKKKTSEVENTENNKAKEFLVEDNQNIFKKN